MKHRSSFRAFTIVELLVVVSIIALLIGILLPAIGKARENAQFTRSQANVKQIGTAYATYGAEWGDRQPTYIDDYMSRYGTTLTQALSGWATAHPGAGSTFGHPLMWLGDDITGNWAWAQDRNLMIPYHFTGSLAHFGGFRGINAQGLTLYLNGRYADPILFAPKDTIVLNRMEEWFDYPAQVPANQSSWLLNPQVWPSYCYSPAAMYNPAVLSLSGGSFFTDPWTGGLESSFRSPSYSQAAFPSLKTMLLEHHWLQGRKRICNPYMAASQGLECQPYFFNHATTSNPVCWYFDGHIGGAGASDAEAADGRMIAQTVGQPGMPAAGWGLWSRDTPVTTNGGGANGYYTQSPPSFEPWLRTSFHTLTIDGIKGRDFVK